MAKVAIVTGAGTGVGRAAALALMKAGYSVALAGRRKEPLEAVAKEGAPAQSLVVPTDVRDVDAIRALFAKVKSSYGCSKRVSEASLQAWRRWVPGLARHDGRHRTRMEKRRASDGERSL